MKRILASFVLAALVFTAVGCGSGSPTKAPTSTTSTPAAGTTTTAATTK